MNTMKPMATPMSRKRLLLAQLCRRAMPQIVPMLKNGAKQSFDILLIVALLVLAAASPVIAALLVDAAQR